jgi:hypothetical protein
MKKDIIVSKQLGTQIKSEYL